MEIPAPEGAFPSPHRVTLAPDRAAPSAARAAVREALPPDALAAHPDVELVVSELVTNAVLHSGADEEDVVTVSVACDADRAVLICVSDPGESPTSPIAAARGPHASSGRGLRIVARVCEMWGVERRAGRTVVWAQLGDASRRRAA